MNLLQRLLGDRIRNGTLTVIMPGGERSTVGSGEPVVVARIHDKAALVTLLRNPRLAFGELYMDGRLTIEQGQLMDLLTVVVGANRFEDGGHKGRLKKQVGFLKGLLPRRNDAAAARRNVAHHYDLDERLYRLFLDSDLQYSCAYFHDPANSLEQAQADKKAHIAAKLDLRSGQRVLDIGSGWGGMGLYLNRVAGVEVLGVTLSEEQLRVSRQRAEEAGVADKVRFELIDYRAVTGRFDRIISVGMFEHVGLAHYREFFATCRNLLTEDGVMLLHTIGKYGKSGKPDPFTDKWIFPGYHVPSLSQMMAASEEVRLIATDVETLRLHYGYTLRHWLANCYAHRAEIVALYDERFFRMWEFYLAAAAIGFEQGAMNNFQVQYVRERRALPITRDYMHEAEQRFRRPAP
ncbi:SAM-dependent methyltransferase [Sphingomonas glaciei]|uniref:Cyclopropane-fatty-acyl-phospholipid synthase family protein n=1 Tax=Sphingomonas glaciei TaxID=2938948 RepID=A0ABY5MSX9_9SPHN|nr:cyclopropane-fatty-acyl-phospholipid synthase family protein [Sphingomonas glaciei]UUR07527.1 cyclopropane-fatty-acyl-phospholipid synthase family protein [Sphingomonas glaciei]